MRQIPGRLLSFLLMAFLICSFEGYGQLLQQRTYSYGGLNFAKQITVPVPGNGFLILANYNRDFYLTGNIASDSNSVILLRLDNNFDTLWSKEIKQFIIADAILLKDGSVAMVGVKNRAMVANQGIDFSIIKMSLAGNLLAQRAYNFDQGNYDVPAGYPQPLASIVELKNGQLFVLGFHRFNNQGGGVQDPIFTSRFFRFSSTLDLMASKELIYHPNDLQEANGKGFLFNYLSLFAADSNRVCISTNDKNYVFSFASTELFNRIIEVDTNMNMQLHKRLTTPSQYIKSIFNISNDEYFIKTYNTADGNRTYASFSSIDFTTGNRFKSVSLLNSFKIATGTNFLNQSDFLLNGSMYSVINTDGYFSYSTTLQSVVDSGSHNFRVRIAKVNSDLSIGWYQRLHNFGFSISPLPEATISATSSVLYPDCSAVHLSMQNNRITFIGNKAPASNYYVVDPLIPIQTTINQTGIFATQFDSAGLQANCNITPEKFEVKNDSIQFEDRPFVAYTNAVFQAASTFYRIDALPLQHISDTCLPLQKPVSLFTYDPSYINTFQDSVVCLDAGISLYESSYNEPRDWKWILPPEVNLSLIDSSSYPDLRNVTFTTSGRFAIKLVVVNAAGADTMTKYLNVNNFIPQPDLGNDTTICNGDSLMLIFKDTADSRHYFTGDNLFLETDTLIIRDSGTYICAAYTNCGIKYDTINVSVGAGPKARFSDSAVCNSLAVFFRDSSIDAGYTNLQYAWKFFKGNTLIGVSNLQNPVFAFPRYDSFFVQLTVGATGSCAGNAVAARMIYLKAKPTASFTAYNNCGSLLVNFSSNSNVLADSIRNYDWDFGDGQISTAPNPAVSFSNFGNKNVKLTVTSSRGCVGNALTQTVPVKGKPAVAINYNNNACANRAFDVTASSTVNGASISNGQWLVDGTLIPNSSNLLSLTRPAGSYTIQYTGTSSQGCSDTAQKNIVVDVTPTVGFSVVNACAGDPVTISNNTSGSGFTFKWDFDNGDSSSAVSPVYQFSSAGNYNIRLTAFSANHCSAFATRPVIIAARPVADFSITSSCLGKALTLQNNSSGNISSYNWQSSDGQNYSGSNPTFVYAGEGRYSLQLQVQSAFGCSSVVSKPVNIKTVSITASNDSSVLVNQPLQLIAGGADRFEWQPSGLLTGTNTRNPVFTVSVAGTYNLLVQGTNSEGCTGSENITITVYDSKPGLLPNAFSPNADTRNDLFRFNCAGLRSLIFFRIYNRYGHAIYEQRNCSGTAGWDGTYKAVPQNPGTYVYWWEGVDFNGRPVNGKGTVVLLR